MPPNILLIIADQLARNALGCYGNPDVSTPHLDALAADGIRLTRAYTTCPLCLPARAAFWTGTLPHDTWSVSNARNFSNGQVGPETATLGSLFQAAGYQTLHFGKQHDNGGLRGFTCAAEEERPVPDCPAWPANYDSRRDQFTLEESIACLHRKPEQPFFLAVDFNNPHDICNWVGAFAGPHADITPPAPLPPLPDNFEIADIGSRPRPIQYLCCSHHRLSQAAPWTPENYRHYLAAYYHFVNRLDTQIGQLLDALRKTGADRNTLIVFMADHGDGMAAHRMVTKQVSFYEETTAIPMLFTGTPIRQHGLALDHLASAADLLPTLCAFAGITPPPSIYGRSFWHMLAEGRVSHDARHTIAAEWMTEWGYTIEPGRMIRSQRYKYTRYLEDNGEELYDLQDDPGETRNRAADPELADVLQHHRDLLSQHLAQEQDPFLELTWQADPRWRAHPPGYQHHQGPSAPQALGHAGKKS